MWIENKNKSSNKYNVLEKIHNEIKSNTKEYTVSNGDSIYAIAKKNSISVEDLLLLNSSMQKEFKIRWKNILIKAWDKIYLPKDIEVFNNNSSKIKEINEIIKINDKFTKDKIDLLKTDLDLYPERVQSIGLPKILEWFIKSQEAELDPALPRIVDSGREEKVSCANLIRTLMAQSVNIASLRNDEKSFLKKQDLHAWILPTELKKIWFDQKFQDLMKYFDNWKIWDVEPIWDQEWYDKKVLELAKYLQEKWVPWSLVPYYFKLSRYKWVVANYNLTRPEWDKHLNTHQSMFAWNWKVSINANEVNDYSKSGTIKKFEWNNEEIKRQINELSQKLESDKEEFKNIKSNLLKVSDISEHPEIKKVTKYLDKALNITSWKDELKAEELKIIILSIGDENIIKSQIEKSLNRKITDEDLTRLLALRKMYYKAQNSVLKMNADISKWLEVEWFKTNDVIISEISKYNKLLKEIRKNEESLDNLKEIQLNVVDYIANFIQQRLDYGPSALNSSARKKVIEWIIKYNSMIKIKIDWKEINLAEEVVNYQNKKSSIFVKPESKIEISWPLMIDWEHQANSDDPDRREKMNSRTRFFFEFIVPQTYLATELLEPNENSSFRKTEFWKYSDKFKVKWTYDIRRWETVEKALKEKIIILEKLNPSDKNFTAKLNNFYSLQIKALKIAWFLQDEQDLNPGAFKINRVIPYFDTENVSWIFSNYIKDKKQISKETISKFKEVKEFTSIEIFPWDTEYHIFNRLIEDLNWSNLENFPNFKNISSLNYYQQKELISLLLEWAYDKNNHLKEWKKISVSFKKINSILDDILKKEFTKAPELNKIDNFVIENTTENKQNQDLIKNIIKRELYTDWNKITFLSRKFIKEYFESIYFDTPIWDIGLTSSIWDFQLRIWFLKYWWNEWLNKETMNKVFNIFEDKEILRKIEMFPLWERNSIKEDLKKIQSIKYLVNSDNLSKEDFKTIYYTLRDLIRLDSWDNTNYVWKVISSVFMESKLNNHFEKLAWTLTFSWENIDEIYKDPNKMKNYERSVILINNQWEKTALYMSMENYIYRLINKWFWINLKSNDVYDDSLKWKLLWKIKYNWDVFKEHLKSYIDQINSSNLVWGENQEVKNLIEKLYKDLENPSNNSPMETIHSFVKNPVIKKFLESKNLSSSLLLNDDEYEASEFHKSAFNYVRKWLNS